MKSIIAMNSTINTDTIRNDFEKFIVDMKNKNENINEKMKELAGDNKEILEILKTINNIVDCKNNMDNTNSEIHHPPKN